MLSIWKYAKEVHLCRCVNIIVQERTVNSVLFLKNHKQFECNDVLLVRRQSRTLIKMRICTEKKIKHIHRNSWLFNKDSPPPTEDNFGEVFEVKQNCVRWMFIEIYPWNN